MQSRDFIFKSVPVSKVKRNVFNISYENKLTFNMGNLVPFYCERVLPHDTFKVGQEYLLKAQPMLAPIMHRVDVYQHYFFVPYRLIWNDWEKFITGGASGTETASFPKIRASDLRNVNDTRLLDFLGYPVKEMQEPGNVNEFSSLPIRAYNFIYNEFYRDQNLQDPRRFDPSINGREFVYEGEGDGTLEIRLANRCWKKDYFTSALPSPTRGPELNIPIKWNGFGPQTFRQSNGNKVTGGTIQTTISETPSWSGSGILNVPSQSSPYGVNFDPAGTLGFTIDDFRRYNRLQKFLERNAVSGGRYCEQIAAHFGIRPSDYRLGRPQYLGGGKQPFSIQEVVQTSSTDDVSAQGNQSGMAKSYNSQYVFKETFEEHGLIIGLFSVLPRTAYQQGINRHLQKFDKLDYAWPEFAQLGEQEIKNKEVLYIPNNDVYNEGTFGYQSRYSEYKYHLDEVHGDFRDSLAYWHLGRIFDYENPPQLNESFVVSDPRKDVFAFTENTSDALLLDVYNEVTGVRALPPYGTPAL